MAQLFKPNTVVVNEIEEYLKLPEISIESNSLACECLFLDAGNLLTNKRTRMKLKLFKKIMFLKRNMSNFNTIHP
ncbi:hypothetical protein RhiirA5_438641 [Rhizophagus irregularis]|uniref:HAT C-terminal dimerisation domain-containing protein n=1 Tax=Rhizophagus irregularis TaxID=588596 RepID=A0A2N0NIV2_9GLOM|nr:hypothetical protein RhiirA5_438641 [Rhizophagus irregularis]